MRVALVSVLVQMIQARAEPRLDAHDLLHPYTLEEFSSRFREQRVLHIPRANPRFYQQALPVGLDAVDALIQAAVAVSDLTVNAPLNSRDVRILAVRGGSGPARAWQPPSHPHVSLYDAKAMFARGFGVVINAMPHRDVRITKMAYSIQETLGGRVSGNMYLSPENSTVLHPHMDWMEVLALQLHGSKTWLLYPPVVQHPFPEQVFVPPRHALQSPMKVLLEQGDLLYVPRGWIHHCRSQNGTSLHLTLGLEPDLLNAFVGVLIAAVTLATPSAAEQLTRLAVAYANVRPSLRRVAVHRGGLVEGWAETVHPLCVQFGQLQNWAQSVMGSRPFEARVQEEESITLGCTYLETNSGRAAVSELFLRKYESGIASWRQNITTNLRRHQDHAYEIMSSVTPHSILN